MPLLRLDNASLHYGNLPLLDDVSLTVSKGEKLGLLGRNGAGKTTLLRVLEGQQALDSGERWLRPGIRMAWLQQNLPNADGQTVFDVVAGGLEETGQLLAQYHQLSQDIEAMASEEHLNKLARVQQKIEDCDGWAMQQRVDTTLSQLDLPGDASMSSLSGGWRRRVALARALVIEPDILLLDEPTNHLDIPAIEWLEGQLQQFNGALILITHDRKFLQNVANMMAELDRGHLTLWKGDYQGFLRFREQELLNEERANALFDKQLAQEEVWIRQGIKARRTRNEGRVRALKEMREKRSGRRERQGRANFKVEDARRSGKIVAEIENVSKAFDGNIVIDNFSTVIQRGDRIGIVGPNGAGKSTLVKLLLGELAADSGEVKLGTQLEVAYSDQLRNQLDPKKNLIDNVCGGQDFIEVNGKRQHAIGYLGSFLFNADRTRMPVSALSGGEQNRAVLAHLFSKPANLLVLDEPTNDLDIETLELLEEILLDFAGTVLLVSHDREFMDNVVTSIYSLDGDGQVSEHIGAYSDWDRKTGGIKDPLKTGAIESRAAAPQSEVEKPSTPALEQPKAKKSYKVERELKQLLVTIDELEKRQEELEAQLTTPDLYSTDPDRFETITKDLAAVVQAHEVAFTRWDELESSP